MHQQPARHPRARNVTVVLGPTNTGKTRLAVERMIGHESGMIGLPLRLLAREVYDTVAARCGPDAVALITGEEKIVPREPRFYVCTVEAMPADVEVDFLAIDEIQLAGDSQRGHIFTDRLLHRRGKTETMMLGASTMHNSIAQLLPGAHFVSRPRFSILRYSGQKKLTRLPPRSAVVCFSADAVYATAELIRRQRGGAAVVLGALSPRTRNAQVALYQSGDVDFIVATDAIGMGLNMDVDHVAFAATHKFDGHMVRALRPAELAQIAGRAGRHMNDGTFGVTGEAEALMPDVIEQLESHEFDAVKALQWRNRVLDFGSLEKLLGSLSRNPDLPGLTRTLYADDATALETLARDPDIQEVATSEDTVKLLWEICQIPDYRNITGGDHAALIGRVFRFLTTSGTIRNDWFARQVSFADQTDGDIDTLSNRIAHIRTWTYIANKSDWLDDPALWQERTRAIEDKLSDALHDRLTQRFVDRRTSVLMKRMKEKEELMSVISEEGEVTVEGQFVGHLSGFHFAPDTTSDNAQGKALRNASMKAVAEEISARAARFLQVDDAQIELTLKAAIVWGGATIARLQVGSEALKPRVQLIADSQLTGTERDQVQERIERWLDNLIGKHLEPLRALSQDESLGGLARGVAFQLVEALGVLVRDDVAEDIKGLDQPARSSLRKHGVRFGAFHIFIPALLKPAATNLKLVLWALRREQDGSLTLDGIPEPPQQGLTSAQIETPAPAGYYTAIGFRECGTRIVRIDMLERLSDLIRPRVFWKPEKEGDERPEGSVEGGGFTVIPDMMSLVGCSGDEFSGILRTLGFKMDRRKVEAVAEKAPAADAPDTEPALTETADAASEVPSTEVPADGSASSASEATEAVVEETVQFLEVWRPKPRNRPERPHQNRDNQKRAGQNREGQQRGRNSRPQGARQNKKSKPSSQPRPPVEKKIDADSPFAALQSLKDALTKDQAADK